MRERPETQPEINRFRRESLIDATIQMVAKHGIENTTFVRISEAAGVSRGLPGHYFRDKDDLLCQAYQHLLDLHVTHTTGAAHAGEGDAAEGLKAFARACLPSDGSTRHYRAAYLAFWTLSMGNKKMLKITSESYRVLYDSVASLFSDAAKTSGVSLDAREEAVALIGMIDGLWLDISIGASGITPKDAVRTISRHIDRLLAPTDPEGRQDDRHSRAKSRKTG
jgi:TetR/AcrR family transcriptional regulator, transcriptional repressor of bet genes